MPSFETGEKSSRGRAVEARKFHGSSEMSHFSRKKNLKRNPILGIFQISQQLLRRICLDKNRRHEERNIVKSDRVKKDGQPGRVHIRRKRYGETEMKGRTIRGTIRRIDEARQHRGAIRAAAQFRRAASLD